MGEDSSEVKSTWLSTYYEILWGPIMWGVDVLLLFLAYGDAISKIAPSSEETLKKLAFLSSLPWYLKIIVILIANLILMGKGALTGFRRREAQRDGYKSELCIINETRPRIVLNTPDPLEMVRVNLNATNAILVNVPFLRVRFVNEPLGPYPSAIAKDITARIKFFLIGSDQCFLKIDGRWADVDQPSVLPDAASKTHLLRTRFGIGDGHSLDIAYFDPHDGRYYAWNNDNYIYKHNFFRHEAHLLEGREFKAIVRLQGEWVDEEFCFDFVTADQAFEFTQNARLLS